MESWREELYSNELYHHGIEGQKWGVRNGPPYPLDAKARAKFEKKTSRLSDKTHVEAQTQEGYEQYEAAGKQIRKGATKVVANVALGLTGAGPAAAALAGTVGTLGVGFLAKAVLRNPSTELATAVGITATAIPIAAVIGESIREVVSSVKGGIQISRGNAEQRALELSGEVKRVPNAKKGGDSK